MLTGRRVVVTRAAADSASLVELLRAEGATVIEAPSIAVTLDGPAVASALAGGPFDWVVLTSANGVRALEAAQTSIAGSRLAVVGPVSAAAAEAAGFVPGLVPDDAIGAALVARFPVSPSGGRVLVAQAAAASREVADGLRAKGWLVDTVVAYRTAAVGRDPVVAAALAGADAVTFLSGSAVRSFVAAYGRDRVPAVVACIGPSTAAACAGRGVAVTVVADPHTAAGVVRALSASFPAGRAGSASW